jgi:hypothetical protein
VLHELERTSVIPDRFFSDVSPSLAGFALKIRRSDEDPRHVWQMITNQPLRLSLAYVAGVSPKIGRKDQSTK